MGDRIPEEVVEAVYERRRGDATIGKYAPIVKRTIREDLQAALPAIHRDLRGRLLGDGAVEAGAVKVRWAVRSQHRAEEQARLVIEAALNTVLPEETDRGGKR